MFCGCGREGDAEIGALRDEVAELRAEVRKLRASVGAMGSAGESVAADKSARGEKPPRGGMMRKESGMDLHDPEFREKMKDPEFRKKMREERRQKMHDPEFRRKMREERRQRMRDPEFRKKMREERMKRTGGKTDVPAEVSGK